MQQRAERVVWLGASDTDNLGDEAYAVRDEVALSFADLLAVVWDGKSPHGLSGGTVRLVFQAAQMMKPVVWLATDGKVRLLDRTLLTAPRLHKLRSPHAEPSWLQDCFTDSLDEENLRQMLTEAVHLVLDPSATVASQGVNPLSDYRSAGSQGSNPIRSGHLHEAMLALLSFDFARARKQLWARLPEAYWGPVKGGVGHPTMSTPLIDSRFEKHDVEASVAAGRHRDSTWLIYGASAMAVFAAVAGAIELWPGAHSPLWAVVELVLVGGILGGFATAKKQRWHGKWISFRFIAEQLRYAKMCAPLLGIPRPFMEPAWQVEAGTLRLASAERWFIQRTMTAQGLPCSADGTAYVACSETAKAKLSEYVRLVVGDQMAYHRRNHHKLHTVHERLHKLEIGLFGATVVAVLAHFVIHDARWLLICTAVFPALAAAVYGLATKLEIARVSGQSAATERDLTAIGTAIDETRNQPGWNGWFRLRQLTLDAARIMSDENDQWQQLILHQEAGLP
jgi:hypothetical protein